MKKKYQKKHKKKYLYVITFFFLVALVWISIKITTVNQIDSTIKTNSRKPYVQPEKSTVTTPEQFGANGFDRKPDTAALQKAIDSGDSLILKSGATYIIDKTLVSNHSIRIETDDKTKKDPVILQRSKQSAFVLNNTPIASTYVTKPISYNQPYVTLASTKGIKPGDLLHLKSTKLWYWDNRGYLKKGELHKIIKLDGNKVYLDRATQESYKVGKGETVAATVYPDTSLELYNISFSHPKPYNTVMLRVNYTSNAKIDRISITNSKRTGIFLNSTFNTEVRNASLNLGTTKDINTGYGIQDYGGTGTFITDSIFTRVRRGVDFSGDTPSRYGTVTNSKAYGYKDGTLATGNSGFGTHSTAEYITFENNYVENFNYAFLARGTNITVKDNTLKGFSRSFIAISFGNHVKLLNNIYQSINGSYLESFIILPDTYRGSLYATANTVIGLKGPFIKGDVGRLESLTLEGNNIKSK